MSDDDAPNSGSFLDQVFELWVDPELERRGLTLDRSEVAAALVLMVPGQPVHTFINDEAELVGDVRATRPIEEGQLVTLDDISEIAGLRPRSVDRDAGWVCFARIGEQVIIAFDARRNRGRAERLADRAAEFAQTARWALGAGLDGPVVENLFAAAELAAVAQILLMSDQPPREHPKKLRWFTDWTKLGNAPATHSMALRRLAKKRAAARYGKGQVGMRQGELAGLVDTVEEMIEHARAGLADIKPPRL